MNIEKIILSNLAHNDEFCKKTVFFLKEEYFSNKQEKLVFKIIQEYLDKYKASPSKAAVELSVEGLPLKQEEIDNTKTIVDEIYAHPGGEQEQWLLDETEKFCKDKALVNAIYESIQIIDKSNKSNKSPNVIPDLLKEALSVSFDTKVGHDYFLNAEDRFDLYSNVELKVPFDLEMFNKITEGGLSRKTLNIVLAPPGGGKSIFLCHVAAAALKANYNVLYITCEMSEERIAERIDANLIDVELSNIKYMNKKQFLSRIDSISVGNKGKLYIKEYPNTTATAMHFRHLLEELKTKKKFKPDIILLDYINICESYKFKRTGNVNSYTLVKSISEEVRALAQEYDLPILTAAQFNRTGASSSDPSTENIAESAGLHHTADLMFALITTEELEAIGQVAVKQLKNRYSDIATDRRFFVGLDKPKMRFHDLNIQGNSQTYVAPAPSQPSSPSKPMPSKPKASPLIPQEQEEEYDKIEKAAVELESGMNHINIFTGKKVNEEFSDWQ